MALQPLAQPGSQPAPPARLALVDKLLYAFASVGNSALFWSQSLWLLYFYSPSASSGLPVRMNVTFAAIAIGIGKFIEVFDDPIIGWWSDRTRSRWGRRIPFLLLGTPVLAVSFWLIWNPPVEGESFLNVIWFFVFLEVFFLARTVVEAPYDALQAEIATTSPDRVSLGAWKVFFAIIGVVVGIVLSPLLYGALGFSGMGLVLALAAGAALYVTLFGLWARGRLATTAGPRAETPPLVGSVREALAHRSFLALAASFMLFNLGYQLLVAFLPYYLVVTLGRTADDVTFFTGGVIAAALIALPFLTFAARRFTKRALYAGSMAALGAWLFFLSVGAFRPLIPGIELFSQSVALISLSGLGFAALFVFPGAMVADVIDDDSRRTGHGRAAIFYGMFKTLEKIAQAGAIVLLGILFGVFGNTEAEPLGIQLAMPVGGFCVLAGFATVFFFYRLREARREPARATSTS